VGRGKTEGAEVCRLHGSHAAACDSLAPAATRKAYRSIEVAESIELPARGAPAWNASSSIWWQRA